MCMYRANYHDRLFLRRHRKQAKAFITALVLLLWLGGTSVAPVSALPMAVEVYEPSASEDSDVDRTDNVVVNLRDRTASRTFFVDHYLASQHTPQPWNGNAQLCNPGLPDPRFEEQVLQRVNYYRIMAGLAPVTLSEEYSRKSREAALLTTLNGLTHRPPATSRCYSADGAQAAANAHLYLGRYGPRAVDGYIKDHNEGFNDNYHVGHRRWLLLPQLQVIGTGDIPGSEDLLPASAIWIVDRSIHDPRPQTREPFVAWPPPGYVPYFVVYPRWSFSLAGADFSGAEVHMTQNGQEIEVAVEALYEWNPTEDTLVWIPSGMDSWDEWPQPGRDTTYTVTITNINVDSRWLTFSYDVIIYDPAAPEEAPEEVSEEVSEDVSAVVSPLFPRPGAIRPRGLLSW
jgi:hypothetical protein